MNKGLDAIRQYKQATCTHCQYYYGNKCNNEYECFSTIVEKDLIRLEELEKAFDALSKEDETTKKFLSLEIEKNRALDIIKGIKPFEVVEMLNGKMYLCTVVDKVEITKENYEILKEVLE